MASPLRSSLCALVLVLGTVCAACGTDTREEAPARLRLPDKFGGLRAWSDAALPGLPLKMGWPRREEAQAIISEGRGGYGRRLLGVLKDALEAAGISRELLYPVERLVEGQVLLHASNRWEAYQDFLRSVEELEREGDDEAAVMPRLQVEVSRCVARVQASRRAYSNEMWTLLRVASHNSRLTSDAPGELVRLIDEIIEHDE